MHCFGMLMDGRAQATGIRKRGQDATLLMILNGFHDVVNFTLPTSPGGGGWELLLDTNAPDQERAAVFQVRRALPGHRPLAASLPDAAQASGLPHGDGGDDRRQSRRRRCQPPLPAGCTAPRSGPRAASASASGRRCTSAILLSLEPEGRLLPMQQRRRGLARACSRRGRSRNALPLRAAGRAQGPGSGLALPAAGRARAERGDRSRGLSLDRPGLARPALA